MEGANNCTLGESEITGLTQPEQPDGSPEIPRPDAGGMTEVDNGPARDTADAEVAGIVEGISNVVITYSFEEWPTLGGPNFRTRAVPRDTTPTQPPPLMGVGALGRGHTRPLSAQRPEHSQHTRREGAHLPSEVFSRGPRTRRNQLLRFQEGEWFKTNNIKLKNPEWTFNHVCGLRLGPRGWPQLDEDHQHIWPLISIREADHLMPYSTLVVSTPEDTRRNPARGIIRLSRKLFYHLPTRKRFCILESSDGQHNIYFEQPQAPYIWGWAPTSDVFGPRRPWRT
ncbi:unnamed protein product [Arctogadus glacialis]